MSYITEPCPCPTCGAQIDRLDPVLVENKELKAEIERLRADNKQVRDLNELLADQNGSPPFRVYEALKAEIERLQFENKVMFNQLEKIADFMVHPYSAAKAALVELGRWKEPKP
jgi:hypothetical protein